MTAPTNSGQPQSIVQNLRSIRDQLSREIQHMTFEQERAYLDKLLAEAAVANGQPRSTQSATA